PSLADPSDQLAFTPSASVSQYLYGDLRGNSADPTKKIIKQQQQNPTNIPIAANGTKAFIGDYTDMNARSIVATGNPGAPQQYRFDCGPLSASAPASAKTFCLDTSLATTEPVFYPAWTDNRDIVRPGDGNWTHHTSIIQTTSDADGNITGPITANQSCVNGQDGSRNSNTYIAALSKRSAPLLYGNSRYLNSSTPRAFVVGVQNLAFPSALLLDNGAVSYCLSLDTSLVPSGGKAAKASFSQDMNANSTSVVVTVPPRSIAARTVWLQSFDDK